MSGTLKRGRDEDESHNIARAGAMPRVDGQMTVHGDPRSGVPGSGGQMVICSTVCYISYFVNIVRSICSYFLYAFDRCFWVALFLTASWNDGIQSNGPEYYVSSCDGWNCNGNAARSDAATDASTTATLNVFSWFKCSKSPGKWWAKYWHIRNGSSIICHGISSAGCYFGRSDDVTATPVDGIRRKSKRWWVFLYPWIRYASEYFFTLEVLPTTDGLHR